jgi:hypothetical protein
LQLSERWQRGDLRNPRTIRTTYVSTLWTGLVSSREERLALMTVPSHPLHWVLPDQRLSISLAAWLGQLQFLLQAPVSVYFNDICLRLGSSNSLLALILLVLLWWVSRTFRASRMLTLSTHFVPSKCRITSVTRPMDTHPNWLFDASGLLVGAWCEFVRLDGDSESLSQLLRTISMNLRA